MPALEGKFEVHSKLSIVRPVTTAVSPDIFNDQSIFDSTLTVAVPPCEEIIIEDGTSLKYGTGNWDTGTTIVSSLVLFHITNEPLLSLSPLFWLAVKTIVLDEALPDAGE